MSKLTARDVHQAYRAAAPGVTKAWAETPRAARQTYKRMAEILNIFLEEQDDHAITAVLCPSCNIQVEAESFKAHQCMVREEATV